MHEVNSSRPAHQEVYTTFRTWRAANCVFVKAHSTFLAFHFIFDIVLYRTVPANRTLTCAAQDGSERWVRSEDKSNITKTIIEGRGIGPERQEVVTTFQTFCVADKVFVITHSTWGARPCIGGRVLVRTLVAKRTLACVSPSTRSPRPSSNLQASPV